LRESLIRTKIKQIQESLALVSEGLPEDIETFNGLGLVKDGIYKRMEFCVENMFDICAVINSDLELGVPGGDEEIIQNLIDVDVLNNDLGDKVRAMKGFRNILVHRYGKIDDAIAFEILSENLTDFDMFIERIEVFLENNNSL